MTINISTKNFELSQKTKTQIIIPCVEKKLGSFTDDVDVVVAKEGRRIVIKLKTTVHDETGDLRLNATGDGFILAQALSDAVLILRRKLDNTKSRSKAFDTKAAASKAENSVSVASPVINDAGHMIAETMSDEEAFYKAELSDSDVFCYRDDTGTMAILMRKGDRSFKMTIE